MSENVREVLELAFFDIYGREPDKVHDLAWLAYRDRERRFTRFLDAEAYTDAALMLVPEDYDWIVARTNGGLTIHALVGTSDINKAEFGDTPALAIAQAALATKGTGDE